jgi:YVTN family beta-propeller protein
VIDLSVNALTATALSRVCDLVVSPDGSRLYGVTSAYEVHVVDARTRQVLDVIPVPLANAPYRIRLAPDSHTVYLAFNGGVYLIDTGTAEATVIAPDTYVPDIAIDHDGARAYLLDDGAERVLIFDASTREVVNTISLETPGRPGGSFEALALSPDGTRLFVTERHGLVLIADTASRQVVGSISVDPSGAGVREILVSPDGQLAYVTASQASRPGGQYRISIIDVAAQSVAGHVLLDHAPGRIALSADGMRLYVANPDACSISVIDTAKRSVLVTIPVDDAPRALALGTRPFDGRPATEVRARSVRTSASAGDARVCA